VRGADVQGDAQLMEGGRRALLVALGAGQCFDRGARHCSVSETPEFGVC
jgi:hypothetical protein